MQSNRKQKKRKIEPSEGNNDDRKMPPVQRDNLARSLAQRMSKSASDELMLRQRLSSTASAASASSLGGSGRPYYPEGQLGNEMRELERRFLGDEDDAKTNGEAHGHRPSSPSEQERILSLPLMQSSRLSPARHLASTHRPDLRAEIPLNSELRQVPQTLGRSAMDIGLLQRERNLSSMLGSSEASLYSSIRDAHQQSSSQLAFRQLQRSPPPFASMRPPPQRLPSSYVSSKKHSDEDTISNNGKGYVIPVAAKTDRSALTMYQTLIRESLEYFTAVEQDVNTKVQGRRQEIVPNQVGIRCKYCSHLPIACRGRAAVYFPKTLSSLYQGAQNIGTVHFPECTEFPSELLQRVQLERGRRGMVMAGRPYWSTMCRNIGVYEADGLLRMIPPSDTVMKGL